VKVYLPVPYPDELLYSVIARYIVHIDVNKGHQANTKIVTRTLTSCVGLPVSAQLIADETNVTWRMTPEDIVSTLTLFPYITRYYPQNCKNILSDHKKDGRRRLVLQRATVEHARFLRFCGRCRANDIEQYGETYWHRSHQIPCSVVCQEHGVPLAITTIPIRTIGDLRYFDASSYEGSVYYCSNDLNDDERKKTHTIARRCHEMLQGPIAKWPEHATNILYRRAALERGFKTGFANLDLTMLRKAFYQFYGDNLLPLYGESILKGNANWFTQMFQQRSFKVNTNCHALVQVFLETYPVDSSQIAPFGYGPWKCPNPLVVHQEAFPINRIRIYTGYHGRTVASAKCSCGYSFSFHRTSDYDPLLPVVNKVHYWGTAWEEEVGRLKKGGMTVKEISQSLAINPGTVMKLLHNVPSQRSKIIKNINDWRKAWLELLDKAPKQRNADVRKMNLVLYQNLLRHDSEWLKSLPRTRPKHINMESRIDWIKRDEEWSNLFRRTADKLYSAIPVRRVSRRAIILESKVSCSTSLNFKYLSKSALTLSQCVESIEHHQERKLKAVRL